MALSEETARQVESLFREHLEQSFRGTATFDPITVEPILGMNGQDIFHVTVVYDADQYLLDAAKLNAITVAMRDQLEALGLHDGVIESYVNKAEYSIRDEILAQELLEEAME